MRRAGVFNDVLHFLSLLYAKRHKSGGSPTHRETLDEAAKDGRNGHRSSASGGRGRGVVQKKPCFILPVREFFTLFIESRKKQIIGTRNLHCYASVS